jgi:hypothetical protein
LVRDLDAATCVVVYRVSAASPIRFVAVALGDFGGRVMARDSSALDELAPFCLSGSSPEGFQFVAVGVEVEAAEETAALVAKELAIPVVRASDSTFEPGD